MKLTSVLPSIKLLYTLLYNEPLSELAKYGMLLTLLLFTTYKINKCPTRDQLDSYFFFFILLTGLVIILNAFHLIIINSPLIIFLRIFYKFNVFFIYGWI